MDCSRAKQIIADNYYKIEDSLCYLLNEECEFSTLAFWEYYEAIVCITRNGLRTEELSTQIAIGYQRFLKEIVWHFDPNDVAAVEYFPENYNDYIERLDLAVRAYYEGKPEWLNDALLEEDNHV